MLLVLPTNTILGAKDLPGTHFSLIVVESETKKKFYDINPYLLSLNVKAAIEKSILLRIFLK